MSGVREKKILLVEDHQFILNVIHDLLTSAGFKNVFKAFNAELALDMMKEMRFDMVITDVEMGEMNGIELLKLIRTGKTPLPADTRVIILTAHANTSVLGTAIALDANGFLVKPAKLGTTVDKIQIAFDEEFKPRRSIGYSVIPTKVIDKPEEEKAETEEAEEEEPKKGVSGGFIKGEGIVDESRLTFCKMLTELEEGMVTSEPVKNVKGMVLIPADQTLTASHITRLKELHDQLAFDYVRIYQ